MNRKSGFLRRVAILIGFAWFMNAFVISDSQFITDPAQQGSLRLFMYLAIAWAIVTLFVQRSGKPGDKDNKE